MIVLRWKIILNVCGTCTDIEAYIERLTHRDLHDGKVNIGGIITITDSNWMTSFTIHRQPHFKEQKVNESTLWINGLWSNIEGHYNHKKMEDCTGQEITEDWLCRLGMPVDNIKKLAGQDRINIVAVYVSYITSCFMPRLKGDRLKVIPDGFVNLAFIGNFAESPSRDTVFTTKYLIRTVTEAVYSFLNVERGVPEVFNSAYNICELLKAFYYLNDKKEIKDMDLPIPDLIEKIGP